MPRRLGRKGVSATRPPLAENRKTPLSKMFGTSRRLSRNFLGQLGIAGDFRRDGGGGTDDGVLCQGDLFVDLLGYPGTRVN